MAKDDYHVLVYRILAYLYECLKGGEKPDMEYLQCGSRAFPVNESYWNYIFLHLLDDGYIEGVKSLMLPGVGRCVKLTADIMITPKGIEYLQDNSTMQKAKNFLKGIKEITPGL